MAPSSIARNRRAAGQSIFLRRSEERGHRDHGWLDTYHTFSFADYYDPDFESFRALRVINEDRIAPGRGFPAHPHRDMEIISYIIEGAMAHRDSLGNGSTIRAGEFQRMSAGTGVLHSEENPSVGARLHLMQIWILPEELGIAPGYEQKAFTESERTGNLRLVGSRDGRAGSLTIYQDVSLFSAILKPGEAIEDRIDKDRYAWIQVLRGVLSLNNEVLNAGDGAALLGGGTIELKSPLRGSTAELLLFDLS